MVIQPRSGTSLFALLTSLFILMMLAFGALPILRADGPTPTPTAPPLSSIQEKNALFNYDHTLDLDVQEIGVEKHDGVSVHDITFVGIPGSLAIKAYLVVPDGTGPFAGILWVHWLGEPETTNRAEFLKEAIELAPKGTVSLLVNAMWSASSWYSHRDPDKDYDHSIEQVIELRRALDLLVSQPNVDANRIGVVGHDYGAMYTVLMSGVDQRAKTYVLIAAVPSFYDWAFLAKQPKSKAEWMQKNGVLELTDSISQVKNASILFQYAKDDFYISRAQESIFFAAAHSPKDLKRYDDNHAMHTEPVKTDRDSWLVHKLDLAK